VIKLKDLITEAPKPGEVRYKLLRDLAKKFEVSGLSAAAHRGKLTINGVQAETGGGAGMVELDLRPKGAKEKRAAQDVFKWISKWFKGKKFKNDPEKTRNDAFHRIWVSSGGKLGVKFRKDGTGIAIVQARLL